MSRCLAIRQSADHFLTPQDACCAIYHVFYDGAVNEVTSLVNHPAYMIVFTTIHFFVILWFLIALRAVTRVLPRYPIVFGLVVLCHVLFPKLIKF